MVLANWGRIQLKLHPKFLLEIVVCSIDSRFVFRFIRVNSFMPLRHSTSATSSVGFVGEWEKRRSVRGLCCVCNRGHLRQHVAAWCEVSPLVMDIGGWGRRQNTRMTSEKPRPLPRHMVG
ncbi:hypothetical protein B9Z55_023107 [Caenorhabditis nigoni]|uniref:Uncharacterized protein n=1 Tax=Caenorhabditis nigoni TaxID=1611254 RepID=A0A2G5SNU5_9PELO|nr:hypothetical protein B9Z55_023107 [Caenorhabditis nigoni]